MRVTDTTATLIDNIFMNFSQEAIDPTILINNISDHFPILLWFNNEVSESNSRQDVTSRLVNDELIEHFC